MIRHLPSRWVFFTVCAFICVGSVAFAETVRLREICDFTTATKVITAWEVPSEQLRGWPKWDLSKEPPISISAAVEKAFQALEPGENRAHWQLESIALQQPRSVEIRNAYGSVFFYLVSLSRKSDAESTREYLVALNGDVIPPKVEKWEVVQ